MGFCLIVSFSGDFGKRLRTKRYYPFAILNLFFGNQILKPSVQFEPKSNEGISMAPAKARTANKVLNAERRTEIADLCRRVFGRIPDRVAFPGGRSRAAFIAEIDGAAFILARRDDPADAVMEGVVMKCLSRTGLVPGVVKVENSWVVQEFVEGIRLPISLDREPDMHRRAAMVDQALAALAELQTFAHRENLQHRVPRIRPNRGWADGNIGSVRRISDMVGIEPPLVDLAAFETLFKFDPRDFTKGDARPGNALVAGERLVWFDWEGCGRRHALDDLAFVLADEWTTIDVASESGLIERYVPVFSRRQSDDEAHAYLMAFGVFHMCDRMQRAIRYRRRDGKWWDREKCLLGDKIGVTKTEVGRMCGRASRWSLNFAPLRPLSPWLEKVADRLELELDQSLAAEFGAGGKRLSAVP